MANSKSLPPQRATCVAPDQPIMISGLAEQFESQRMVLRRPLPEDARVIFESYGQDTEVARYMVWRPHTALSQTEEFIAGCRQAWEGSTRMPYVLAFRETPLRPIGMIEARGLDTTLDIGYVLARPLWGQALMPEAVATITGAALAAPGIFRVQATCDTENRASARTLEKSGFSREGTLRRSVVHPNLQAEPRDAFMYAKCR